MAIPSDLARDFVVFGREVPTRLCFGRGALNRAGGICRDWGSRALLVTGRQAMDRLGVVARLGAELDAAGVAWKWFADLHPGPTTDDLDRGAGLCRDFAAELVIGLGGGSALDAAKAIAAVAAGEARATNYLHGQVCPPQGTLPVLAIPTTSGTGSELNRSAIVTDSDERLRVGIRDDCLFPRVAIVDPLLTCTLDAYQTACTGFDCLSHAIESYVSPKARPDTDQLALRAIQLVTQYLPAALADPLDILAREQLALASTTMGINLSCVGTCYPHRVDKALCALHPEIPHGQSVAMFYPSWISFSHRGNVPRFAQVAQFLTPSVSARSAQDRAAALPTVVSDFLKRIGLTRSLSSYGVTEEEIPELVLRVSGDLTVNPVSVDRAMLPDLLTQALHDTGSLP